MEKIEALTKHHYEAMGWIKEGATIFGLYEAIMLREVQAFDEELLEILGIAELERIENKVYNGAERMPYFGAILTDKGRKLLEGSKQL